MLTPSLLVRVLADFASVDNIEEGGERRGYDTSFLDDHITAEKMPIEVAKRQLENKYTERGYLLPKDLEGLPTMSVMIRLYRHA